MACCCNHDNLKPEEGQDLQEDIFFNPRQQTSFQTKKTRRSEEGFAGPKAFPVPSHPSQKNQSKRDIPSIYFYLQILPCISVTFNKYCFRNTLNGTLDFQAWLQVSSNCRRSLITQVQNSLEFVRAGESPCAQAEEGTAVGIKLLQPQVKSYCVISSALFH